MEYHPCRTRSRSLSDLSKNFTDQVHPHPSLFYCDFMLFLLWFQVDLLWFRIVFYCNSNPFYCDSNNFVVNPSCFLVFSDCFIVIPGWGFGLLKHHTLMILPQQPEQTLKWKNTVKTQMMSDKLLCYFTTTQGSPTVLPSFSILVKPEKNYISSGSFKNFNFKVSARCANMLTSC